MDIKIGRKHLQNHTYQYTWSRDKGNGEYTGIQDQEKIDKDEGYEVLYFIQTFMNKHNMKTVTDIRKIEDAIHGVSLNSNVMRNKLIAEVEGILGLSKRNNSLN